MKKMIVCGMAVLLMFSTVACGKDKEDSNGGSTQQSTESSIASGTQEGGTEGTTTGGTEGTDTEQGAGGEQTGSSPLQYLKDAVVEVLGDDYWPNAEITAEMLETLYGINADMYDAFFGEMPMISTNVDTLLIIQAKEDQVEAVEEALNAYRDRQISDSVQYPMNVGKVQASRIQVSGNYVIFAQLGADVMNASENSEEAVIDQCLEANEKAIDAIEKAIVK